MANKLNGSTPAEEAAGILQRLFAPGAQGLFDLDGVFNSVGTAVSIQDGEMRVLYQNSMHRTLAGGDGVGRHCYEAYAKRESVCEGCPVQAAFHDGAVHTLIKHVRRPGGAEQFVEITASPLRNAAGRIEAGIEIVHDITAQKRTERALREERNFVATVLDTVDALALVLDRDGRIVRFNRACEKATGYAFEEVEGRFVWDLLLLPEDVAPVKQVFRNLTAGMFPNRYENHWVSRDGRRILIAWSNTALLDRDGSVRYVIPTGIDVTEQRKTEAALAAETEQLEVTLRSISDGVITIGRDRRVLLMNPVAEQMTGWRGEDARGKPIEEVFCLVCEKTREPAPTPVDTVLATGRSQSMAHHRVLIARNGGERVVAESAGPILGRDGTITGAVLVFRDMTERRILEEEMQKAQKMESLGVLAGGIAHDYNNLLTGILGNVNLAGSLLQQGDDAKARERLGDAERAAVRAKDLTRQLLTFSKGGAPDKKVISLPELLREAAGLVLRGTPVRCDFSIPGDLRAVEADEGQVSQVMHNLLLNAAQAMGDEGGTVWVRCENASVAAESAQLPPAGDYVKISVRDQGCGIAPDIVDKIFDPYFTTKKKGVGLGLATSYSIVKRHEGLITVESNAGSGTVFHVYLPAYAGVYRAPAAPVEAPVRGTGRILIMDDEEIVRSTAAEMLLSLGYTVDTARDGAEAVQRYAYSKEAGTSFDAVIMDITVPGGMGGRDAVKALLKVDQNARAILSSGYAQDSVVAQYRQHGFADRIMKPYTVQELGCVVRRVIDAGRERAD